MAHGEEKPFEWAIFSLFDFFFSLVFLFCCLLNTGGRRSCIYTLSLSLFNVRGAAGDGV
jgi:hypothetical protein